MSLRVEINILTQMADCIFCKIVSGEVPSKKIFEDEDTLSFHDINPKAPVHFLIIPKKHIDKLAQAKEEDKTLLGKIQLLAARLAKDFGIGEAFRLLSFNGKSAGQTVFHLHYHVRGGWEGKVSEDI